MLAVMGRKSLSKDNEILTLSKIYYNAKLRILVLTSFASERSSYLNLRVKSDVTGLGLISLQSQQFCSWSGSPTGGVVQSRDLTSLYILKLFESQVNESWGKAHFSLKDQILHVCIHTYCYYVLNFIVTIAFSMLCCDGLMLFWNWGVNNSGVL